jgi:uncharacterized membrane protein
MKSKLLTLMTLSTLMVILFLGMASAVVNIVATSDSSFTANPGDTVTFNLDLRATQFTAGNIENATLVLPALFGASTSWTGDIGEFTLNHSTNESKTVSIVVPSNQITGTYTGEFSLVGDYTAGAMPVINNLSVSIAVESDTFCRYGTIDTTDLTLNVDISNRGEGDDEEWLPLDTIQVDVKLENDQSDDLDDVFFEIGLFEEGSSTSVADDMIWISQDEEEADIGDIKEGKDKEHTFEFRVDPDEISDGNYILMVKAYPEDDEDVTCIDFSEDMGDDKFGSSEFAAEIDIIIESDDEKMVIIDEESLPMPFESYCGQQSSFIADIYNIGDQDFEDQILVTIFNNELGINDEVIVYGDLDAGEKTEVVLPLTVPSDAEEAQYTLYMRLYYDYDSDEDEYDELSDNTFIGYVKVEGNCVGNIPQAGVSANLETGGMAGDELVIKSVITNTDDEALTYIIAATNYEGWADSMSLNQDTFSLLPGESREVLVTFATRSDAEGEHSFNLEVYAGDQLVVRQPVSFLLEKSGFSFTGAAIGENGVMWAMGLLNIILILIVIIVAVKLARK